MHYNQVSEEPDTLEILFANRNKAYGAYVLRRSYPGHLARAFGLSLLLLLLFVFFSFRRSGSRNHGSANMDSTICLCGDLPALPEKPLVPKPLPRQPVPKRATIRYVPPLVQQDEKVPDDEWNTVETVLSTEGTVSHVTAEGTTDVPPDLLTSTGELEPPYAENTGLEPEQPYELFDIQKAPGFPGGERALIHYLVESIRYPELARENNIQGVVVVAFVIDQNGKVKDVSVVKDIGGGCGLEASRIVQAMPDWTPGEANGHSVKVRYMLPIRFSLH